MNRITGFDSIKNYAMICVILIHSAFLYEAVFMGNNLLIIPVIIDSLSRFAVPFFFATTGFMFHLKVQEKGFQYYKGYSRRIVFYYVLWSFIYLVSGMVFTFILGSSVKAYLLSVLKPLDFFYYGKNIAGPLWFLPALFYSVTLLSLSLRYRFLNLLFILSLVLHLTGLLGEGQNYSIFFKLPVFTRDTLFFGLFYTLLGAFFHEKRRYTAFLFRPEICFTIAGISAVLLCVERAFLMKLSDFTIRGDYYITLIPLVISLFLGALSLKKPAGSLTVRAGRGSLGIYLIHPMILVSIDRVLRMAGFAFLYKHIWFHFTLAITVYTLSWFTYYTLPGWIKNRVKNGKALTSVKKRA